MIHKVVAAPFWKTHLKFQPEYENAQARLQALTDSAYRAVNPVYVWKPINEHYCLHVIHTQGLLEFNGDSQPRASLILEKIVVDAHLEQLKVEFDAKLAAAEKRHKKQIDSILAALRAASQDALRDASLRLLEEVVTSGMVEKLPERLAELIDQSVTAAFQRARDNP